MTHIDAPYVLREMTWKDGSKLYALILEQPNGLYSLENTRVERHENGLVLIISNDNGSTYRVGAPDNPLPGDILEQEGGLDVFMIDEEGQTVDGRRFAQVLNS